MKEMALVGPDFHLTILIKCNFWTKGISQLTTFTSFEQNNKKEKMDFCKK